MADEDSYFYYQSKGLILTNRLKEFDSLHAGMIVGKRDRSGANTRNSRNSISCCLPTAG